ncbi:MAG: histidine--tRNA ligase [Patescibacteria group bacterium]
MNDNSKNIPTRVLTGFVELLPEEQLVFDEMVDVIKGVYELYGFVPIDTPAIERSEVVLANAGGETEKQLYRFTKGKNDLSLRFDLTVSLARYVSEHFGDLDFPFKRYHIGKVYRGERAQRGRFREFYQCDIDIVGNEKLGLMNDAEILRAVYDVFRNLDIGKFIVRISNRKLLVGLFASEGLGQKESVEAMRVVDKLEKVGEGEVRELLSSVGLSGGSIDRIFGLLSIKGSCAEVLEELEKMEVDNEVFRSGVSELSETVSYMSALSIPEECYRVDLTIARGLDYYTGMVFETELADYPDMGSVCSGGRYDNLAENYGKRKLPGVGASIGLNRLFHQLKEKGILEFEKKTQTEVLVLPLVEDLAVPFEMATLLREEGIPAEVYLEGGKMEKKLSYADKRSVPFVIIIGEDEVSAGRFTIKDMKTGEQGSFLKEELLSYIKKEE